MKSEVKGQGEIMEETKTCGSCKWKIDRHCMIPLYVDGDYFPGRAVTAETPTCFLYEAKDAVSDK